jgi:hypothetical protein
VDWFSTSVNYWGILIMLIGLAFNLLAGKAASRVSEIRRERAYWLIRATGLLLAIIGALIAMKIIGG